MAAIERVLKSSGRDWHDLAGLVTAGPPSREPPRRPQQDKPYQPAAKHVVRSNDLIEEIRQIRESGAWLNKRSEEFLDGLDQAPGAIAALYRGENLASA